MIHGGISKAGLSGCLALGIAVGFGLTAQARTDDPPLPSVRMARARKPKVLRGDSQPRKLFFGIGVIAHQPGKFAGDKTGSAKPLGVIYPTLQLSARLPTDWGSMPGALLVSPSLAFTPFAKEAPDKGSSSMIILPSARVSRRFGNGDAGLGLGMLLYRISGGGGTITERNGVSERKFALPSGSTLSMTFMLDVGGGYQIGSFRFDGGFGFTGLLSSRRAMEIIAGVSYGIL